MLERLPENLRALRAISNRTQKEAAQAAGVSTSTLSAYENGTKEPTLSVAVRLATLYHVSLEGLCGIELPEAPKLIEIDQKQDAPPDDPDEDWAHKPYNLDADQPKSFQI